MRGALDANIFAETILAVGRLRSCGLADERLYLLRGALLDPVPSVRDAAAVALASLGDARAIPNLESALETENVPGLPESYKQTIEDLKTKAGVVKHSQKN